MIAAIIAFNLASYCQGVAQSRPVQRCMPIESENVCLCGDFVEVKDTNRIEPAPVRAKGYFFPPVVRSGAGTPITYPSEEIDDDQPLKFKPKRK